MSAAPPGGFTTGILLYSCGVFFFALNDGLGKWLVADYSVGQLLLLRTAGAALVLLPMLWHVRADLFSTDQLGLKLLRVVCMACDTYAFYFATKALPLADVMTFYMASPLIITALAVPFLGEKVGLQRWAAVGVGFVGVVVALQPGPATFSVSALIALFGAVMYAAAVTATRRLRGSHWLQLVVWQFAFAGVVGAVASPFDWVTPGPVDLGLMFLVGIVSMLCFVCITKALSVAPASVLAPFQYAAIIWAALLGWLIWGDTPTLPIVAGNGIIVASGLFLFYRERRRRTDVADHVEPIP